MKKQSIKIKLFLALIIFALSCNKEDVGPRNHNEIKATIVFNNGDIVTIDSRGSNATMGCSFFSGTFLNATDPAYEVFGLSINSHECVVNAGTYFAWCSYSKNSQSPYYTNSVESNPSFVTFTRISDSYMEGYFSAIIRCGALGPCEMDSVVVTGSFKGDNIL